jgi:hypothetical protein
MFRNYNTEESYTSKIDSQSNENMLMHYKTHYEVIIELNGTFFAMAL